MKHILPDNMSRGLTKALSETRVVKDFKINQFGAAKLLKKFANFIAKASEKSLRGHHRGGLAANKPFAAVGVSCSFLPWTS